MSLCFYDFVSLCYYVSMTQYLYNSMFLYSSGLGSSMSLSLLNASALDKPVEDPHSSEHLIALQQLQEQLDSSKKQLQLKDQQLLERDKKVKCNCYSLYECNLLFTKKKKTTTDRKAKNARERQKVKVLRLQVFI